MTAPAHCVLEGTTGIVPRWPAVNCEDMGGLQFQDAIGKAPRPNEHLSSLDYKQMEMLVQRLLRMIPALSLDLALSSSAQSIYSRRSVVDALNGTTGVTVIETGTGLYRVTFTAGVLPPRKLAPRISSCYPATLKASAGVQGVANQIDVSVRDNAGTLVSTQAIISLDIFGEGT